MVLWLGSQPIPFNQQAPEVQRRVPRDYDSYVNSALELRTDFSSSLDSWGANFAEELKKAALELVEINPSPRFVETQLGTMLRGERERSEKLEGLADSRLDDCVAGTARRAGTSGRNVSRSVRCVWKGCRVGWNQSAPR